MLESRYIVNEEIVEAKTPEQAARKGHKELVHGAIITVIEWTGETTRFVVGKKGRLEKE